ncbi:mis18-binding protein 1 [Xenentodon cancila]
MASYSLLQNSNPRFESPAKVFAKLKSKVQKEAMLSKSGGFTGKVVNHEEKVGADFQCHSKTGTRIWTSVPKENHRCFGREAEALTLSPMSSPAKTFDYSCSNTSIKPLEEASYVTETVRGCTRRLGAFLESTAVSQSPCMFDGDATNKGSPRIRDSDGFRGPIRTPQKPAENRRRDVSDTCAAASKHRLPASVFSPMKNRLRKRKWEQQGFNNVTAVNDEHLSPPQERRTSTFIDDYTHKIKCTQDFSRIEGCPGDQPEVLKDPRFPPSNAPVEKLLVEGFAPMSPAKMFAYMKERENKREQVDVHSSSRRDLFGGNPDQSEDTPLSTAHGVGKMENVASVKARGRPVPAHQCRADSVDSRSETDLSEDTLTPTLLPQPVLLEDPLLLNSPKLSIPKKCEDVFKRNRWCTQKKFPAENVIYLKKWFLRKNSKGLFVDGIHREDNIPWNSNIIVERVSNSVLKTVSGRVYVLVGKINVNVGSDFPKWFLKKFLNGFPPNWKSLYEKFLSESKNRAVEHISEGKIIPVETKPDHAVKRRRQKSSKTPEICPPTSSCSSTKTSRSGRVIKPPLEYWKGGRVILDAHMNVTIHEGYDTFCSEASATESPAVLQNPVRVFRPCSRKQSLSVTGETASVPERRVKARRKRDRTEVNPQKKATDVSDNAFDHLSSNDELSSKGRKKDKEVAAKKRGMVHKSRKCTETSPGTEPLPKSGKSSRKRHAKKGSAVVPREQDDNADDGWSEAELQKLQEAVSYYPKHIAGYWAKVGWMVGTRSAEECHRQHTCQGASQTPLKTTKRHKTEQVEAPKAPVLERPVISARAGTLKRKQQVREFLETLPREDVDDAFSSAYMQNKRFEMPSMCPSDDHDFALSDLEPQTPMSSRFPEVRTPQCLHITPGMLGSPNTNNCDKYVYQLQKRMKKSQFNVHKSSPSAKKLLWDRCHCLPLDSYILPKYLR